VTIEEALTWRRLAIIYLRLSDFRDEDDTTFEARAAELRELADDLHLTVVRVAVENDLNGNGNGKGKGASAYKTPKRVMTPTGLLTFRVDRPVFEAVALDLQQGRAQVLIVSDDSRIARNERDGYDLLDACAVSRASVVAPGEDGEARWVLTNGGTDEQVSRFKDRIADARRFSDDIAAKVRKGRRRWAGKSYQGGRRPFGYEHDKNAPEHKRRLIIRPAEATVITGAAADILDHDTSLRAIAAQLRAGNVPTVTGTAWSAETLRDVLLKPTVAGLQMHKGTLHDVTVNPDGTPRADPPWRPILDRATWERLKARLNDPARRTNTGNANAPRWLGTGIYRCGACDDGATVQVSGMAGYGPDRGPGYRCEARYHCRLPALKVDQWVTSAVIAYLARENAAGLLPRPEPRPGTDHAALDAEARRLTAKRDQLARLLAEDVLTETGVRRERRRIDARLAAIAADLAAPAEPDPFPELREPGADLALVWNGLSLPRRRQILPRLMTVTLIPATARGPFDGAACVRIEEQRG
jgi:DNA invertase Pin-like site-specific DNA recombinase